jgi:hypothetical protein
VVVIGRADEMAGVAFLEQLEDESPGEEREVVGVGLDGGEHLANMRLAFDDALNMDIGFVEGALVGRCRRCGRGRYKGTGATLDRNSLRFIGSKFTPKRARCGMGLSGVKG